MPAEQSGANFWERLQSLFHEQEGFRQEDVVRRRYVAGDSRNLGEVTGVFTQLSLRLFAAIGALRVALFVHLYHYARRRL